MASTKFAAKCEEAGVDAIVAEGFEAGGHNGREETTTLCLIPVLQDKQTLDRMWILRKYLADKNPIEAMDFVKYRLEKTKDNDEFLMSMNS